MAGRRGGRQREVSPSWEDTLSEVARALRGMRASPSRRRPAVPETPEMVAAREFRRHDPPRFDGTPDPMAAEDWLN